MDATFKTRLPGWHVRIEGERDGVFPHPEGGLRPGVEYAVGLMREGQRSTIRVVAFAAADACEAAQADRRHQRASVLRQMFTRLDSGWDPSADAPPVIIADPPGGYRPPAAARASFMDRLLGRGV